MRQDDPTRYSMNRLPISEEALRNRQPWPPLDVRMDLLTDVCHRDLGPSRRVKVTRRVKKWFDPLSGAEVHDEVVDA